MENYRHGANINQTSSPLQLYFTRKIICLRLHKVHFLLNLKLSSLELENAKEVLFSNNVCIKYKDMLFVLPSVFSRDQKPSAIQYPLALSQLSNLC